MYLNRLQIINYRNLGNCEFRFSEGVNTIIGENDSGKSNTIIALRMLLDNSYYLTNKSLQESDFSFLLDDWKGHWIIISGELLSITSDEKCTESIAEVCINAESEAITSSMIGIDDTCGYITLFIRPNKVARSNLSKASNKVEFDSLRNKMTLFDYEVVYTGRSTTNYLDKAVYKKIVGDFEIGKYCNPSEDDMSILGCSLDIRDFQSHISVVTIDALRDVESELRRGRNPIRKMIESIQANISEQNIGIIKEGIKNLNDTISSIDQIRGIGTDINNNLESMIGSLYSPKLKLESQMNNELNQLAKFISLKPDDLHDINLLGLGHLNMIFIALKLVEFEVIRTREVLNMMLIEEPEAHIHNHIQRTLFSNINPNNKYTQVVMTTHSVHISEVSEISRVNVMKSSNNVSIVMQPSNELDEFGVNNLQLKNVSLTKAVERYLDSKRSVLMFSKGIILVEGDGEEILIPNLVKHALGISLDELGIGIVNIGSVAFEYIASLFDNVRIQKKCAIITDSDKQAVDEKSCFYKEGAESIGNKRKEKLNNLFKDNHWVEMFYSEYTFEIDFVDFPHNRKYIKRLVENVYTKESTIKKHQEILESEDNNSIASTVFTLTGKLGKGWYATLLADELDMLADIPNYILEAIAFVANEVISDRVKIKMISNYLLSCESTNPELNQALKSYRSDQNETSYREVLQLFLNNNKNNSLSKLIRLLIGENIK